MTKTQDFTKGKILGPLLKFAMPVLLALFLQSLYGAVDLIIVGKFASTADVSGVSTGSQLLHMVTQIITGLSMGATILLGQMIGQGRRAEGGKVVGASICFFTVIGITLSIIVTCFAKPLAIVLKAPDEALLATTQYTRICGAGCIVIMAYNLIGSIFRGIGDSRTPLITVIAACIFNIGGDLLLVAVFKMGAAGAAYATVAAQLLSVVISFFFIKKQKLPFDFNKSDIKFDTNIIKQITGFGTPIALQDFLVGLSFLVIMAIVNNLGLTESASIGVSQKVTAFIMLLPASFAQSVAAFVAQNFGAKKIGRANKCLVYGMCAAEIISVFVFFMAFYRGDLLAGIFTNDMAVVLQAANYMKAYAIDCLLTSVLFSFVGYFNGFGKTRFVMVQGLVGAFFIRIPVSYFMSKQLPVSLFKIGLATPCATFAQILMCLICLAFTRKQYKKLGLWDEQ